MTQEAPPWKGQQGLAQVQRWKRKEGPEGLGQETAQAACESSRGEACVLLPALLHWAPPSQLAPRQSHQEEKSPGGVGNEAQGRQGHPRTSSSQELRSLLCEARSPEPRDEIKLLSFPISSERRVCSSCRQSQETSEQPWHGPLTVLTVPCPCQHLASLETVL